MSQRYFCPAEYTTKTKPKTNLKTLTLNLVLVLGLGLVCTPLGKHFVGSSFSGPTRCCYLVLSEWNAKVLAIFGILSNFETNLANIPNLCYVYKVF